MQKGTHGIPFQIQSFPLAYFPQLHFAEQLLYFELIALAVEKCVGVWSGVEVVCKSPLDSCCVRLVDNRR